VSYIDKLLNKYNGRKLTNELFIERSNKIHDFRYDYSLVNYINSKTKVKIICKTHGVFEQTPDNHTSKKHGCSMCYGNNKSTKHDFIIKAKKKHGDKYDYSLVDYVNNNTKVKIICPKHGEFNQKAANHTRGDNCPVCNTSKGELKIQKILEDNNIPYIRQHKFSDCKNIRKLSFDFYLPNYNICIEYDGIQHFKQTNWRNGILNLKKTQERDEIKNKYCSDNKIKLIRIKYNDNIDVITLINKKNNKKSCHI
jgi:hypothetical protein